MRWGGLLLMVPLACGCAHAPVAAPQPAPALVVGAPAPKVDPTRSEAEQAAWKQAANYTNIGKDTLIAVVNATDAQTQDALLVTARTTYFSAVRAWTDALAVTTVRTYATRFWLADAWNKLIRIEYIQKSRAPARYSGPAPTDVAAAITAATAVRDAIDGDEYVDLAAAFVIEENDVLRDLEYLAYEETKGASGIAKRTLVELEGSPGPTRVKVVPIPEAALRSIQARVDYMHRVPQAADADRRAAEFGFEAGQTYYVYGHLEEARTVLGEVHREQCRKSLASHRAWELLLAIASKQHDEAEARRLAAFEQVHACGTLDPKPESRAPLIDECDHCDADRAFVLACGRDLRSPQDRCDPVTATRVAQWRASASAYRAVFDAEPAARSAPAAVLRGAFSYKQAGDAASAIALYERFAAAYGDESILRQLDGGPKGKAPSKELQERLEFLNLVYEEASSTYLSSFDLSSAASLHETAARRPRIEPSLRRAHALTALELFSALGSRSRFEAVLALLPSLESTPSDLARAALLRAELEIERWRSGDGTALTVGRADLGSYYRDRRAQPFAAPFVFRAAWELSRIALETSDPSYRTWLENARAARVFWARNMTQDGRATYDAQGPIFAQLDREFASEQVTATTSLAAIFRVGVSEVSVGPVPVSP